MLRNMKERVILKNRSKSLLESRYLVHRSILGSESQHENDRNSQETE